MVLLAEAERDVSRPLVAYLGLFRSSRALSWDRALRLATEVVALGPAERLGPALAHTVESLRSKQQQGGWKPLSNHNYLRRVIDSTAAVAAPPVSAGDARPTGPLSKTAAALAALEGYKRG